MRHRRRFKRTWLKCIRRRQALTSKPDRRGWPHPFLQHCAQAVLSTTPGEAAPEKLRSFLRGVEKYQAHPHSRQAAGVSCFWQHQGARLWDYSTCAQADSVRYGTVLLIPSLINASSIFDIHPKHSMARWLARHGFRPLLLDWGEIQPTYDLADYHQNILLQLLIDLKGVPLHVLGYCLGGIFAMALARDCPEVISLTTLGTSWDYAQSHLARLIPMEHMLDNIAAMHCLFGGVPMLALQSLFSVLDPTAGLHKFQKFVHMASDSLGAEIFVSVEDWLNQGKLVPTPVVKTLLEAFIRDNALVRGAFTMLKTPLDATQISTPALIVAATKDKIAPLPSIEPLAHILPKSAVMRVNTGHIGMIASQQAPKVVWTPIARFMRQVAAKHQAVSSAGLMSHTKRRQSA